MNEYDDRGLSRGLRRLPDVEGQTVLAPDGLVESVANRESNRGVIGRRAERASVRIASPQQAGPTRGFQGRESRRHTDGVHVRYAQPGLGSGPDAFFNPEHVAEAGRPPGCAPPPLRATTADAAVTLANSRRVLAPDSRISPACSAWMSHTSRCVRV